MVNKEASNLLEALGITPERRKELYSEYFDPDTRINILARICNSEKISLNEKFMLCIEFGALTTFDTVNGIINEHTNQPPNDDKEDI